MADKPDWNATAHWSIGCSSIRLWRRFTDRLQLELFERWAPAEGVGRLLKTDLFDEAVSEGLLPGLSGRAAEVIGIDVSMAVSVRSRQRYKDSRSLSCDVRCLPIAEETIDFVVSGSTLDHFAALDEVAVALGELHRVLRRGARMMLTMDNLANPAVWLRGVLPFPVLHRIGLVPYFVGKTTGPDGLRQLVEGTGFRVVDAVALMHCPRAPMVAVSKLINRRGSAATQQWFVDWLMGFERMRSWPSRNLTAYFSAVLAEKPSDA